MASSRLIQIISKFLTIVTVVHSNMLTLDGQCPIADMNPITEDASEILGNSPLIMKAIAETVPSTGANRTDITEILEFKKPDIVKVTLLCRSKETNQCGTFFLVMKPSNQPGIYDSLYQVAPNGNFAKYKAAFLSFDSETLTSVAMACRSLSYSEFQIELVVLSATTSVYDEATQKYVKKALESNNLGYLNQYVKGIEQKEECPRRKNI